MKRDKFIRASKSPPKPSPMPAIEHYCDLTDLDSLIASRPETFWCYTHLADLPLSERSVDPRYCKACNEALTRDREDSRASGNFRRPWWVPQNAKRKGKDSAVVEIHGPPIKSMINSPIPILGNINPTLPKAKGDNSKNRDVHKHPSDREGKNHQMPAKRMQQLAFDGMGIKEAVNV